MTKGWKTLLQITISNQVKIQNHVQTINSGGYFFLYWTRTENWKFYHDKRVETLSQITISNQVKIQYHDSHKLRTWEVKTLIGGRIFVYQSLVFIDQDGEINNKKLGGLFSLFNAEYFAESLTCMYCRYSTSRSYQCFGSESSSPGSGSGKKMRIRILQIIQYRHIFFRFWVTVWKLQYMIEHRGVLFVIFTN